MLSESPKLPFDLAGMPSQENTSGEWPGGQTCPVCGSHDIRIEPGSNQMDSLTCSQCSSSFEVALNGAYFHPLLVPAQLKEVLTREWYALPELRDLAAQTNASKPQFQAESQPVIQEDGPGQQPPASQSALSPEPEPPALLPVLDPDTLRTRAGKLYQLGNSLEQIERTLLSLEGADGKDVRALMADLRIVQFRSRSATLRYAYFIIAILILISGVTVFLYTRDTISAATVNLSNGLPMPNSAQPLEGMMQWLSSILRSPAVAAERLPADFEDHLCPLSAEEAARLFGGQSQYWKKVSSGWALVSLTPVTVAVPSRMGVGYLNPSLSQALTSAPGPVKLYNVTFAAVSCR